MIPSIKQEQILSLLETGLSIREVAARMEISRETIAKIKNKSKAKRCLECGTMVNVFPCVECQPEKIPIKKKKIGKVKLTGLMEAYIAEAPEIFRIVEDLRSLHELGLVKHLPESERLFIDLGERAKNSLNRIFPPTEGHNAKKKKATE